MRFGMGDMGSLPKLLICAAGFLLGGLVGSLVGAATGINYLPGIFGIIGLVLVLRWVKDR